MIPRVFVLAVDLLLFVFLLLIITPIIVLCMYVPQRRFRSKEKILLIIDTAFSYNSIETKSKREYILQRNLGGFFSTVYNWYPILGAHPADQNVTFEGSMRFINFAKGHVFIESKMAWIGILTGFPRTNFLLSQFISIMKIRKLVLKEKVSVVRGCDPFLTGLYSLIISKMTGRLFALRVGADFDLMYMKNKSMVFKKIFKWYAIQKVIAKYVLPRAALMMAANQSYLNYALDNGARKEASVITRFGNIIDPIHFTEPATRPLERAKYSFIGTPFGVYVGRLTKIKMAPDLLYVGHELKQHKEFSDINIVLIGDGDLRNELEKMASDFGLGKSMHFLGECRQDEIAGILPHASVYLAPHSGLSLVEAALAGVPLIAYDYEWHPELVKQGITGELVPHHDWKKMAESFWRILRDPGYGKTLGANARMLAMEMMDQKKIQAIEKEQYKKLLNII
jgi:glycosyltransferase involved in cell wall biosynthesis